MYPSNSKKFSADSNILKMYLVVAGETLDVSLLPVLPALHIRDALLDTSCVYELHPVFLTMLLRMIEMVAETQHGEYVTHCKQGNHDTIIELSGHTSLRFYLCRQNLEEIQVIHNYICDTYAAWRLKQRKL
jgi:hypothetical protein